MEKDITLLGNEYMDNTIRRIKDIVRSGQNVISNIDRTFEFINKEYRDDIRDEFNRLKPSDKLLIGDILAICKRSDRSLGRPKEDCINTEDSVYVIIAPSKEAVITCKDINNIAAPNGKFKFLSVNYLVDQILEFNFTYIQIALCNEIQVFNNYYSIMSTIMKELGKERNNEVYTKLIVNKAINTVNSVLNDIEDRKKPKEQINNRLFFVYNVLNLAETYLDDKILSFYKKGMKFDTNVYNKYIKEYTKDSIKYIEDRVNNLKNKTNELPDIDKETAKLLKLSIKSRILEDTVKDVFGGK